MTVQAVILAGGLGTRLAPQTRTVPKAMTVVNGRPFVELQLESLRAAGVSEVVLLAGHLGDAITAHVGDGTRFGLRVRSAVDDPPQGTGGAIRAAARLLAPEFLLLNGDTFLRVDFWEVAAAFRVGGATGALVARRASAGLPANLVVAADGRITAYEKHGCAGGTHVDAGAGYFSRDAVRDLPRDGPVSFEQAVYPRLAASCALVAYVTRAPFFDIGTFEGLSMFTRWRG